MQLFLEGSPIDVEVLLDEVSLNEDASGGDWKDAANARIDQIRTSATIIITHMSSPSDMRMLTPLCAGLRREG